MATTPRTSRACRGVPRSWSCSASPALPDQRGWRARAAQPRHRLGIPHGSGSASPTATATPAAMGVDRVAGHDRYVDGVPDPRPVLRARPNTLAMGRIRRRLARCALRRPCRGNRQRADENISTLHDPSKSRELGRHVHADEVRLPSGRRECGRRYQRVERPCARQPGCDEQLRGPRAGGAGSIRDERGCGPQGVPQRGADRLLITTTSPERPPAPGQLRRSGRAALLVSPTALPAAVATDCSVSRRVGSCGGTGVVSLPVEAGGVAGVYGPVGLPPPCSGSPDRIATRRRLPCRSDSSHRRPAASRSWSQVETTRTHLWLQPWATQSSCARETSCQRPS